MALDETSNKLLRKTHGNNGDNAPLLAGKGEVMDTVRIAKAYKLDESRYGPVSWRRKKK